MSYSCPLNFIQVDSYASRVASFMVVLLVIMYLISFNVFILYFLMIDFSIRLFVNKKYSPISLFSLKMRKLLKMKEKLTDGGAKRLASIFGIIFVCLLFITHFIESYYLSYSVGVVFLFCALLDVFFNYCVACKVYYVVKKVYPSFMS